MQEEMTMSAIWCSLRPPSLGYMDLNLEKMSRVHFIHSKDLQSSVGFLTDTSMNGTWVSKIRVGKSNKMDGGLLLLGEVRN